LVAIGESIFYRQERNMFLDTATIVAILILITTQLTLVLFLFRSSYRWEQAYWDAIRLLKIERQARDIRN
jgi:hypothetical protein